MKTEQQLNEYIKHYLEDDQTKSAIMLTGPWGSGKSYYIKNSLMPFLNEDGDRQKKHKKNKCICVSLYGLQTIQDISKAIYLELRFKKAYKHKEFFATAKAMAKTVAAGAMGYFGVGLNISDSDLSSIYSSVDLTGKLIILEDIERTNIDISQFLGFVNNLTEHDGVKVLLVANEEEIWLPSKGHYFERSNEQENKIAEICRANDYYKIKEKTIFDTIKFLIPPNQAIKNILREYKSKLFVKLVKDSNDEISNEIVDEIANDIMCAEGINCQNLRLFNYACQKTNDLFECIDFDVDNEFLKTVFMSHIAYALKQADDSVYVWPSQEISSKEFGTDKYPLFLFSYNFMKFQELDIDAIRIISELEVKKREELIKDAELQQHLNILYSYYTQPENAVRQTINYFVEKLKDAAAIPFNEYFTLINYLIAACHDLDCKEELDDCKTSMRHNVEVSTIGEEKLYSYSGLSLESKEQEEELKDFKNELINYVNSRQYTIAQYDYSVEKFDEFCEHCLTKHHEYLGKRNFLSKINIEKLVKTLSQCSAQQINKFRRVLHTMYRFGNVRDYFAYEKILLIELKEDLNNLVSSDNKLDKIQLKQLKYLCSNIDDLVDLF